MVEGGAGEVEGGMDQSSGDASGLRKQVAYKIF